MSRAWDEERFAAEGESRPKLGLIFPVPPVVVVGGDGDGDGEDGLFVDAAFIGVSAEAAGEGEGEGETPRRQLCITSTLANAINPIPNGITKLGSGSTSDVNQATCSFANAAYSAGEAAGTTACSAAAAAAAEAPGEARSIAGGVARNAAWRIVSDRRRKIGR